MKLLKFINIKAILLLASVCILLLSFLKDTEYVKSSPLAKLFVTRSNSQETPEITETQKIVSEESIVIDVVERSLPSVVTIGISKKTQTQGSVEIDPNNPFSPFRRVEGEEKTIEQNIGSGFIISKDGIIITNKHVVFDTKASYTVLTDGKEEYDVTKIYRDPLNDLAILKIEATDLVPLALGDSSKLKLGQLAIAIGTPLGEFQNTITTGIVSGLGRGITAGSPFQGFVEELSNVIQTDAAISPGNSGGPLLNSSGQVVGVNTAIAGDGQNIGFAIPVNVVKELISTFESQGGTFERPYIGVRYNMVDKRTAILNEVVEGAFIETVIKDSPADLAGVKEEDIITRVDGKKLDGENEQSLAKIILNKKVGDTMNLEIWRDGKILKITLTLAAFSE
ncbi:MAG: trypsin-like peptidase domain-containing protein [Candidatus Roizmanbacteria bacterium]|nr:trypsin-like peptidase domain-containing protein [Candidatus Roizmanbacteria bacterium]